MSRYAEINKKIAIQQASQAKLSEIIEMHKERFKNTTPKHQGYYEHNSELHVKYHAGHVVLNELYDEKLRMQQECVIC